LRSARTVRRAPPISLQNLLVDEGGTDTVVYRAPSSDYFRTDTKVFPAVAFLVQLLQHLPDSRRRLIRTYGLYSSPGRQPVAKQIAGGSGSRHPLPGRSQAAAVSKERREPALARR